MRQITSAFYVPVVLCAIGFTLVFQGCEKAQEAPPRESPASYMNDKDFRGKLTADRKERQQLLGSRGEVVSKMKAMIDAKKRELGTDDLSKVKAELDKDPEWQALYKQCEEANAKLSEHRKNTLKTVRERITPKNPISK